MELAKKLCYAYGPAGREDIVRGMIEKELEAHSDSIRKDRLGNLIVYKKSSLADKDSAKKIMFCAHMDEIGVIITHIDKNGFLRFSKVGGVRDNIVHQRVLFENGIIGTIGVETKKETPSPPGLDNMFIDIGINSREDAKEIIHIGDIACFYQNPIMMGNRLSCKALDDRIGCYCLIESLKRIEKNHDDLYFVFTVQEEVGLRGARTGAYAIDPDYAIAIDVTGTGDTPESQRMDVGLGKGVAIKVKDRAFISNPYVKDKLIAYAENSNIPYQLEVLEFGTTDAAVIQLVKGGIMSGVLSIPTRYVHSTNEVCDFRDVEATIKLLAHIGTVGLG